MREGKKCYFDAAKNHRENSKVKNRGKTKGILSWLALFRCNNLKVIILSGRPTEWSQILIYYIHLYTLEIVNLISYP